MVEKETMRYCDEYWNDIKEVIKNIPSIDQLRGKCVMLTGATGLIGSSLVDVLAYLNKEYGYSLHLILAGRDEDRMKRRFQAVCDHSFAFYDAERADRLDIKADPDLIIHAAGNAHPGLFSQQPVETLIGCIEGTRAVLDAAKDHGARVCYISSSEVYGRKDAPEPYKEDDYGFVDALNPRSCYPNGKRAAETLCAAYISEFGTDAVIVRPGHIYGPNITETDSRATAQFTRNAYNGEDIVMKSAGLQRRSYCYSLDCASAILTVLLNGNAGQAYNIANRDSQVSIREFAEEVCKYTGRKVIFENPSDEEKRGYNLMENSTLDPSLLEALGWKACFDLHSGVKRTIDLFRSGE